VRHIAFDVEEPHVDFTNAMTLNSVSKTVTQQPQSADHAQPRAIAASIPQQRSTSCGGFPRCDPRVGHEQLDDSVVAPLPRKDERLVAARAGVDPRVGQQEANHLGAGLAVAVCMVER
jgi:hypothetical protein